MQIMIFIKINNYMINGPCCLFFFFGFFLIKFCLPLIFDFFTIELIFPSYVIKILSEIIIVLIQSNNIYINHTNTWAGRGCSLGAYASEFLEPTGDCSRPAGGLKHVIIIHAGAKCKISTVVDPTVSYTSHLELSI